MTRLRYLGHSAFLITNEAGRNAVVDPFLTANPHTSVTLEDLPRIDLILVTHGGFDHLGDAYEIQRRTGALLAGSVDVVIGALEEGIDEAKTFPMVSGAAKVEAGFAVQAVEARHVSLNRRPEGRFIAGQPLGFVIWPDGRDLAETSIYHLGDTSLFLDLKLFGELYRPRLALVGMGGEASWPHELTPDEAAMAVAFVGAEAAIPMHFLPGSSEPDEFRERVAVHAPDARVLILGEGDEIALPVVQAEP